MDIIVLLEQSYNNMNVGFYMIVGGLIALDILITRHRRTLP